MARLDQEDMADMKWPIRLEQEPPVLSPVKDLVETKNGEWLERADLQEMRQEITSISNRFNEFVGNIAKLNESLGEFRDKVAIPLTGLVKNLDYTVNDSAISAIASLHALARRLNPDTPPTQMELEQEGAPMAAVEALQASNEFLSAQNARLIAELEELKKKL